jgi:excisionase family DNA binding protein
MPPLPSTTATHCSIWVATEKLCCVRSHVYNLLGAGKITALKAGRRTLVSIESIDAYMASLAPANIKPPRNRLRRRSLRSLAIRPARRI